METQVIPPFKMNVEQIVEDLVSKLQEEDKVTLAKMSSAELGSLHHTFGMSIRNFYGLWTINPLTESWRNGNQVIVDGVDHTDDHPDNISMTIIEKLWAKLRGI